jgi:hypothetical protein
MKEKDLWDETLDDLEEEVIAVKLEMRLEKQSNNI